MERQIKFAKIVTSVMYTRFSIGNFRFGFYLISGLIPGLGDLISLFLAVYIMRIAIKLGLPMNKLLQMIFNILLDLIVGLFPIAGDVIDAVYKSHVKNIKIIEEYSPSPIMKLY